MRLDENRLCPTKLNTIIPARFGISLYDSIEPTAEFYFHLESGYPVSPHINGRFNQNQVLQDQWSSTRFGKMYVRYCRLLATGIGVALFAVSINAHTAAANGSPPDQFPGGTSGAGGRFMPESVIQDSLH